MNQSDELREFLETLIMKWEQMLELNYEDLVRTERLLSSWIRIVQQVLDEGSKNLPEGNPVSMSRDGILRSGSGHSS